MSFVLPAFSITISKSSNWQLRFVSSVLPFASIELSVSVNFSLCSNDEVSLLFALIMSGHLSQLSSATSDLCEHGKRGVK